MPCCSTCNALLSVGCRLVATLAAHSVINQVVITDDSVFKRRRWYAGWLRIPGNLLLHFRTAPVKVLSRDQWIERECQISGATRTDNGLRLPKIEGIPLAEFLAATESTETKREAISIAIRALFDFHQRTGQSHGDASATNVMINQQRSLSATWFDFDTAHSDSFCEQSRADDLRAILSTTQGLEFDAALKEAYPDEKIWELAISLIAKGSCDIFHLAQQQRCRVTVASSRSR